ncbi:hypothetical protein K491DRAFT_16597 [Lophiostoma macrostomum CBS 122681]|uniref:Zn(2)-C6 fungal-type domain-containing protein n=1 Tax=Lophiostoma macrostomum CBS 122681 TaxID=1314788 RepID=A0A6A6TLU3_9PLEO|nr:hypothetical protein K491DRAFT_16597 [Lophiostoma macrostomum CBS 122681]
MSEEESQPKRKKLNMVKCDRCRADKQSCVPVIQASPSQRCKRCVEKDLPCSERRRAVRSTRCSRRKPVLSSSPSEPRMRSRSKDYENHD